ncbi:MAG: hypothetical protein ACOYJL_00695 [Tractidigestivibacter sp.]|jgi:hypothetical protein|uniref:hypothetical protein n=1 Tax=Tractidigestivibacter sp. TaxID=2847320 RepID=UPI003D950218
MAISSESKLSEILEDERAVAIIDEYVPGFVSNPELGPVKGMKMKTLLKFPQTGLSKDVVNEICSRLDALDA